MVNDRMSSRGNYNVDAQSTDDLMIELSTGGDYLCPSRFDWEVNETDRNSRKIYG